MCCPVVGTRPNDRRFVDRNRAGRAAAGHANPWEQPGEVRRDCLAHRGPLLLPLADAALLLGILSPCLGFLSLMAVALGTAVWALS
jgi:hypothetical protein